MVIVRALAVGVVGAASLLGACADGSSSDELEPAEQRVAELDEELSQAQEPLATTATSAPATHPLAAVEGCQPYGFVTNDASDQFECAENTELRGLDLTGAYLYGAYLRGADLESANLTGANLILARLEGANLTGANLSDADLSEANLRGAILDEADLSGADLYFADLNDANLTGADLAGANLKGTFLRYAKLTGANLTGVTGWDTVRFKDTLIGLDEAINVPD